MLGYSRYPLHIKAKEDSDKAKKEIKKLREEIEKKEKNLEIIKNA